jgi:hypothetical protein
VRYYAGIGSRGTPEDIQYLMFSLAFLLENEGWTLRTGCAPGADQAFAKLGNGQWFLPWPSFEQQFVKRWLKNAVVFKEPTPAAYEVTRLFHPGYDKLGQAAKKLHARNAHQILGPNLDQSEAVEFVLCWTPDAKGGGGTGQALRIAEALGITVFDLANPYTERKMRRRLGAVPEEGKGTAPTGRK